MSYHDVLCYSSSAGTSAEEQRSPPRGPSKQLSSSHGLQTTPDQIQCPQPTVAQQKESRSEDAGDPGPVLAERGVQGSCKPSTAPSVSSARQSFLSRSPAALETAAKESTNELSTSSGEQLSTPPPPLPPPPPPSPHASPQVVGVAAVKTDSPTLRNNPCSEPVKVEVQVLRSSPTSSSTPDSTPASTPQPPVSRCPSSEPSLLGVVAVDGRRLTPQMDSVSCYSEAGSGGGSSGDLRAPSPVPDGQATPSFPLASYYYPLLTVPHVPYTGYTAVTIPASPPQPPLPEKRRTLGLQQGSPSRAPALRASTGALSTSSASVSSGPSSTSSSTSQLHVTFSPAISELTPPPTSRLPAVVAPSVWEDSGSRGLSAKFVQDSSKFWYKPGISRDQGGQKKCVRHPVCLHLCPLEMSHCVFDSVYCYWGSLQLHHNC